MSERKGELRFKDYKHRNRGQVSKKKREQHLIELRKQKRNDVAWKKRNIDLEAPSQPAPQLDSDNADDYFAQLHESLLSSDLEVAVAAVVTIRELVSQEHEPPLDAICSNSGVIEKLVEFSSLTAEEFEKLQFESLWCITNIAAGESSHCEALAQAGAVNELVVLLSEGSDTIKEQAAWALGNLAGDSSLMRNFVLEHNVVQPLTRLIECGKRKPILRNASWAVTNLCRGKNPPPAFDVVKPFLDVLLKLVCTGDDDIVINACWYASYLAKGSNKKIQAVIETGVPGKLVELLMHPNPSVVSPALRTLGFMVTGNDVQTQIIINCSILPSLKSLLSRGGISAALQKECMWVLSNILAGTETQIEEVIQAHLLPKIIEGLESGVFKVQREAAWAICNATTNGTGQQIEFIVSQEIIPPLCNMLKVEDAVVLGAVLQGIFNICVVGARGDGEENVYRNRIEQCGGLDQLGVLALSENEGVRGRAQCILDTYLADADDNEQGLLPESDGGRFQMSDPGDMSNYFI